jgi:hypothetical protein
VRRPDLPLPDYRLQSIAKPQLVYTASRAKATDDKPLDDPLEAAIDGVSSLFQQLLPHSSVCTKASYLKTKHPSIHLPNELLYSCLEQEQQEGYIQPDPLPCKPSLCHFQVENGRPKHSLATFAAGSNATDLGVVLYSAVTATQTRYDICSSLASYVHPIAQLETRMHAPGQILLGLRHAQSTSLSFLVLPDGDIPAAEAITLSPVKEFGIASTGRKPQLDFCLNPFRSLGVLMMNSEGAVYAGQAEGEPQIRYVQLSWI